MYIYMLFKTITMPSVLYLKLRDLFAYLFHTEISNVLLDK